MSTLDYEPERTNLPAILGMIFAFVFWPLGLIFGHLAWAQCRRSGEPGRGLAVAALILSYLLAAITIFGVTLWLGVLYLNPQH